ncbi:hypothetical protein CLV63_1557 [Murinocardiopsis flavida]|uniref:3'-phosphoadenosine 5'-phosphosulfate sulfotransferase (PAPS reductase)/FAD synthetase n=1 Tax=Murinocardiopsis flavida TaxID=645275 RepID=A0A2P8C665_9ACTN|nr:hypothetical protein [Murinocardiopsis flavida]PSK80459.1 hypothetical protein CLV63_1557 [Murinocardiopsis flavida]
MKHVVMFSGGITSWEVARRVAREHGPDDLVLLFADTRVEDPDLYRFTAQAAHQIGVPITRVADGRDPWQVFADQRRLGNSQIAPCSYWLKIKPCRDWLNAHTDPASTTVYLGIDWTEMHRLPAIERGYRPFTATAPLTEAPYTDKRTLTEQARAAGLEPPRLYRLGFAHNNCGGACVRGGQAQWAHLLRVFPERYAAAEQHEQRLRAHLGADVAILRDRTGGTTRPLTLTELRHRIHDSTPATALFDLADWGGCGCTTALGDAA